MKCSISASVVAAVSVVHGAHFLLADPSPVIVSPADYSILSTKSPYLKAYNTASSTYQYDTY